MIDIVIPTYNEEAYLSATVKHVRDVARYPENLRLIVVDAGSGDNTAEVAEELDVEWFCYPLFVGKKFLSLNAGARVGTGEVLLFLDADTRLPNGFDTAISRMLRCPDHIGGAFEFAFHTADWFLLLITCGNRLRYRLDKCYFSDQAMFIDRAAFERVGGFGPWPLMETAYMSRRLRQVGKIGLIKMKASTSERRFIENGRWRVLLFDIWMWVRFTCRLPVHPFAKKYWQKGH